MVHESSRLPERSSRWRVGVGAAIVVCIAVVVIGALITAFSPRGESTVVSPTTASPTSGSSAAPDASRGSDAVFVHVAGAVVRPGLYQLLDGARVVDAIAAAGGFAELADRSQPNLARLIADGEQLYVPLEGETPAPGGGSASARISINTADVVALDTLPRVGPALAARIVAWREAHGPFTSIEDLLSVSGIGQATLDGFRDSIVL